MKSIIKKYFVENKVESITLTDRGDIDIEYKTTSQGKGNKSSRSTSLLSVENIDLSKGFPEIHEVREYLRANNKKSLTRSELGLENTKKDQERETFTNQNKPNYLSWIVGGFVLMGMLVGVIWMIINKHKSISK